MADTHSKGTTTEKDKTKSRLNPIQVQKYLKGLNYPVQKKDILQKAKANGAEQMMLDRLQALPEQSYERPTDVTKAIGKLE
jgi:hypothetical protein